MFPFFGDVGRPVGVGIHNPSFIGCVFHTLRLLGFSEMYNGKASLTNFGFAFLAERCFIDIRLLRVYNPVHRVLSRNP